MKLMSLMLRLFTLLFVIISVIGCQKTNIPEDPSPDGTGKIPGFTVTVLERTPTTAIIVWDSSRINLTGDTVKYRVILENNIATNGLVKRRDTLRNLAKNVTYTGKVVAYIKTGDTTYSTFNLSTYDGAIYAYSTDGYVSYFGSYNSYPQGNGYQQPFNWRLNTPYTHVSTISNDTVFAVSNHNLLALSATTGSIFWRVPSTQSFATSVTYSNGRLYGCLSTGELVCINSRTGQTDWTYRSTISYVNFNSIPVVDGDKVFVSKTNSNYGEIHAVEAVSGKKVWETPFRSTMSGRPLAAAGALVVVSGIEGSATAYDQNNGNVLWKKTGLGSIGAEQFYPIRAGANVLVQTLFSLYALDLKTGMKVWEYDHYHQIEDCVRGNGRIYFSKTSFGPTSGSYITKSIVCVDEKTGKVVWNKEAFYGTQYYHFVFAKDKLYTLVHFSAAGVGRRIVAFNATTGEDDQVILNTNPMNLKLYENVDNFIVSRDSVTYYPSYHGNYK